MIPVWLTQTVPAFDDAQRWVANNGLGAVFSVLLLLGLMEIVRRLLGNMGKQITGAVSYFTSKLDAISTRQELTFDRLDERLAGSAERQAMATEKLADSQRDLAAAMAGLTESQRNILMFMSQNMAQVVGLRHAVERTGPPQTGVITPVIEPSDQGG
jgi:hypothetical protein